MKVFVLGHTGMLGRYVYSHFHREGHDVIGLTRNEIDASQLDPPIRSVFARYGAKPKDVVINCMGIIKSVVGNHGTLNTIRVNSIFPYLLADVCEEKGYNMIHITTDCVYSGKDGYYTEGSLHDCTDVYGKTKSLGEPPNCTIIRTSIIGEEFGTSRSLIEWVKSQDGKTVNGYTDHWWNGMTCHQTAKVMEKIVMNNLYWKGVRHIFTPKPITKCDLVRAISHVHELDVNVDPVEAPEAINRTLSTVVMDPETSLSFSSTFEIPNIVTQLKEQYHNPPNLEI